MNICIFTDNAYIYEGFCALLPRFPEHTFDFFYSPQNRAFSPRENFRPLRLKEQDADFYDRYDLFLSLHSKQLFPDALVEDHLCINVHPGLNPHNRGWFPQVFSILNGLPIGVTIHRMDTELDHGPILWQEELPIYPQDTSKDVYDRILANRKNVLDFTDETVAVTNESLQISKYLRGTSMIWTCFFFIFNRSTLNVQRSSLIRFKECRSEGVALRLGV